MINSKAEYQSLELKLHIYYCVRILPLVFLEIFFLIQGILHIKRLDMGLLAIDNVAAASMFFYLIIVASILFLTFLLGLYIYYFIRIILAVRILRILKHHEVEDIATVYLPYDYKLWQTAPKDSFHKMVLPYKDKEYMSGMYFTNSKKIKLFKVNPILQSHSYVKDKCQIGYSKVLDEVLIVKVLENSKE